MTDSVHDHEKLLHRIRRIQGQVNAVELLLREKKDCATVLLTLSACRGAINSLMGEVLEDHVRLHMLGAKTKPTPAQKEAAEDLIEIVRSYLK